MVAVFSPRMITVYCPSVVLIRLYGPPGNVRSWMNGNINPQIKAGDGCPSTDLTRPRGSPVIFLPMPDGFNSELFVSICEDTTLYNAIFLGSAKNTGVRDSCNATKLPIIIPDTFILMGIKEEVFR